MAYVPGEETPGEVIRNARKRRQARHDLMRWPVIIFWLSGQLVVLPNSVFLPEDVPRSCPVA
jgi:hypothetical protein